MGGLSSMATWVLEKLYHDDVEFQLDMADFVAFGVGTVTIWSREKSKRENKNKKKKPSR